MREAETVLMTWEGATMLVLKRGDTGAWPVPPPGTVFEVVEWYYGAPRFYVMSNCTCGGGYEFRN